MPVYQTTPRRSNGELDSVPVNFDPASYPIISRHWFNVEPFRPIGEAAAEVVEDVARRAIGRWLDKAAEAQIGDAAEAA